ncbi:MAG: repeat protein, partial [Myxococcaceae bacterium]|nr:repeat protein [Myxococcaceae bacterium]
DYDGDGISDLLAIKRAHTESGTTELHALSGASNYQTWLLHTDTALGPTPGPAWAFGTR